jgi:hypothetical protein
MMIFHIMYNVDCTSIATACFSISTNSCGSKNDDGTCKAENDIDCSKDSTQSPLRTVAKAAKGAKPKTAIPSTTAVPKLEPNATNEPTLDQNITVAPTSEPKDEKSARTLRIAVATGLLAFVFAIGIYIFWHWESKIVRKEGHSSATDFDKNRHDDDDDDGDSNRSTKDNDHVYSILGNSSSNPYTHHSLAKKRPVFIPYHSESLTPCPTEVLTDFESVSSCTTSSTIAPPDIDSLFQKKPRQNHRQHQSNVLNSTGSAMTSSARSISSIFNVPRQQTHQHHRHRSVQHTALTTSTASERALFFSASSSSSISSSIFASSSSSVASRNTSAILSMASNHTANHQQQQTPTKLFLDYPLLDNRGVIEEDREDDDDDNNNDVQDHHHHESLSSLAHGNRRDSVIIMAESPAGSSDVEDEDIFEEYLDTLTDTMRAVNGERLRLFSVCSTDSRTSDISV